MQHNGFYAAMKTDKGVQTLYIDEEAFRAQQKQAAADQRRKEEAVKTQVFFGHLIFAVFVPKFDIMGFIEQEELLKRSKILAEIIFLIHILERQFRCTNKITYRIIPVDKDCLVLFHKSYLST